MPKGADVVSIDQTPIRGSRRSNPATYTGLLDPIPNAFAKANGVKPALFSANSEGACPNGDGAGVVHTDLCRLAGAGLGCLSLGQPLTTLSGGEPHRLRGHTCGPSRRPLHPYRPNTETSESRSPPVLRSQLRDLAAAPSPRWASVGNYIHGGATVLQLRHGTRAADPHRGHSLLL